MGIEDRHFPSAWGSNKKEAEQKAAFNALVELEILEKTAEDPAIFTPPIHLVPMPLLSYQFYPFAMGVFYQKDQKATSWFACIFDWTGLSRCLQPNSVTYVWQFLELTLPTLGI